MKILLQKEQQVTQAISRLAAVNRVPGLAVGLIDENAIDLYPYGISEDNISIRTDTLFPVASISKPLTAWVICKLVEEGIIQLDNDIGQYPLPTDMACLRGTGITIRHLLSHTAGLEYIAYFGVSERNFHKIDTYSKTPYILVNEPGSKFLYTGLGYTILQKLLEEVTQKPFAILAREVLFTSFGIAEHTTFDQKFLSSSQVTRIYSSNNHIMEHRFFSEVAAAGALSNIRDLSRFTYYNLSAHRVKNMPSVELLSNNLILEMHKRFKRQIPYGLGFVVKNCYGTKLIYHNGRNPGIYAYLLFLPQLGKGIVILTNSNNGSNFTYDFLLYWLTQLNIQSAGDIVKAITVPKLLREQLLLQEYEYFSAIAKLESNNNCWNT